MRFYKIKNVKTMLYVKGVSPTYTAHGMKYYITYLDVKDAPYLVIDRVNNIIDKIIDKKLGAKLDDLEIITYEQVYTVIASTIKMKNVRARSEQRAIMDKLKGD